MSSEETIWSGVHKTYAESNWINKPNIFAEQAIEYFPESGKLLELGAGLGQDSQYFVEHGYVVTSTDLEPVKLQEKFTNADNIEILQLDLRKKLPFADESYDIVYAHLSLHYFDAATTNSIFDEIYRVLKPGGILAFFTNTIEDPEYGTGEKIEENYFMIGTQPKRYLSTETAKQFARKFKIIVADNMGETYKDLAKGIHNLIRFIGRK